jgi:hypothetical protein
MLRVLKIVMIIWGAIGIIAGLSYIIIPAQVAELYSLGQIADYVRWLMAFGGAIFISAGVWVIVAAGDPLRHINWVKFEITKSLLVPVVTAYSIIQGDVLFSQVGPILILFAVFAVALLVLYPWRTARSSQ